MKSHIWLSPASGKVCCRLLALQAEALRPMPRTPADDDRDALAAFCRRRMARFQAQRQAERRARIHANETWQIWRAQNA